MDSIAAMAGPMDKQLWWDASPLWQLVSGGVLPADVVGKLEASLTPLEELCDMEPAELGALVHHPNMGGRIADALAALPYLELEPTGTWADIARQHL